jgi:hypothetical protein
VRLGVHGRSMHLYVEVEKPSVRYGVPERDETRRAPGSDRVIVLTHDEFGHERAWSINAIAPGPLLVHSCEIGAPWKASSDEVPYVEGIWRETGKGYAIELRAPLNLFGTQLAIQALLSRVLRRVCALSGDVVEQRVGAAQGREQIGHAVDAIDA